MYSRKKALTDARRYRTCPPPDIARDPSQQKYMEEHLSICPYCSQEEEKFLSPWESLIEPMRRAPAKPETKQSILPRPGRIHSIRPELALWRDGYYYSPPFVLVLDADSDISDEITVAQTYHDIGLAAPGDLILTNEHTGIGDLFIECWNTYTLRGADLAAAIGRVTGEALKSAKNMEKSPEKMPGWAVRLKPLSGENDFRGFFRKLEVEVAYTFSSRAVAQILKEYERPVLSYASPDELMEDIRNRVPNVRWIAGPPTLEAALAAARLPPEMYAMAAAVEEEETIQVNLCGLRGGRLVIIDAAKGRIEYRRRTREGLDLAGGVSDLPGGMRGSGLWCFLYSEKAGYSLPESVDWDEEKGKFLVRFKTDEPDVSALHIAVVYEIDA